VRLTHCLPYLQALLDYNKMVKEALVGKGPKVTIRDTEIPEAGSHQLVIKVVVSGSNPKDWKIPEWRGVEINSGDDIAGTVHEVGKDVTAFKVGDRGWCLSSDICFLHYVNSD
jgi:NADPH:quinone reductase-like Zn-dependent oxidoreductase